MFPPLLPTLLSVLIFPPFPSILWALLTEVKHAHLLLFLSPLSIFIHPSHPLTIFFTHRDFEGGTLGLAWTGDLKNAGGVCEKNGHYRGSLKVCKDQLPVEVLEFRAEF